MPYSREPFLPTPRYRSRLLLGCVMGGLVLAVAIGLASAGIAAAWELVMIALNLSDPRTPDAASVAE